MAHKDGSKKGSTTPQPSTDVETIVDDKLATFRSEFKSELLFEFREMLEAVLAKQQPTGKAVESPLSVDNNTPPPPGWPPQVPPWPYTVPSSSSPQNWVPPTYSWVLPRQYKIDLPKFNGENFRGWYLKLQPYFEVERVPDEAKVMVTTLSLEGDALEWHQYFTNTQPNANLVTWSAYLSAMREHFASEEYLDPLAELVGLKHTGTVTEFYKEFIPIFNLLKMSDAQGLNFFSGNLKDHIASQLIRYKPQTLHQAIE
ncbi:Retrotransposon gag protein [Corchorus olitorius]|uniref:Retrotransposon gag protein n=1 Tax=Corchorus olitorius TaxID=93759 RepID=A0A1R3JHY8_9ROSI|nr:Retrotransposon gag protein [Corchorus olitorius]